LGIPRSKIKDLTAARNTALAAWNADKSSERNVPAAQTCRDAFDSLKTFNEVN